MRAASHFWLLGSGIVEVRARIRNGDFSVVTGGNTSNATPLAQRIYTNVQDCVVN